MKDVRNILFDFGNVIIDIDLSGARRRVGALLSGGLESTGTETELTSLIHRYETGQIATDDFLKDIASRTIAGISREQIIEAWNSMLIGIPPYRLSMLEALKEQFAVLMLSNTNALHLAWVQSHLFNVHRVENFERRFFHDVYYSHLIGKRKPEAEAYKHVVEDAMITPAYTLFIDDLPENIRAAKRLGFQVLLSPEEEEIAEVLKLKGFY